MSVKIRMVDFGDYVLSLLPNGSMGIRGPGRSPAFAEAKEAIERFRLQPTGVSKYRRCVRAAGLCADPGADDAG